MDDQSTTSKQKTLPGINEPTSSPESAGGSTPCALPDGLKTERSGPAHVPASHFHKPEGAEDLKMIGIYGLFGTSLSRSASLQQSLENKLLQMMEEYGSIEYVLTWKRWDMPSGPPICALRASTPRISDKDCGGWPTPTAAHGNAQVAGMGAAKGKPNRGTTLAGAAQASGWPTPNAMSRGAHKLDKDGKRISGKGVQFGATLQSIAAIAGWTTPAAMDTVDRKKPLRPSRIATGRTTGYLSEQVYGTNMNGSLASTEKPGALNPALGRWLMGYAAEWDEFAPKGTH